MILAHHLIPTAYGFWLPNDPRGSGSAYVGSHALYERGAATKVTSRKSQARKPHNTEFRLATKSLLKYPPVRFTGQQAKHIGEAFSTLSRTHHIEFWACAIMPDHAHFVIARHTSTIERLVILLKGVATRSLVASNLHPFQQLADARGRVPHMWARDHWAVYLDSIPDVRRSIRYVNDNPVKQRLPRQHWSFVTPYQCASAR